MKKSDKRLKKENAINSTKETSTKYSDLKYLEKCALNHEQVKIINWLKNVNFEKKLVGGVAEEDVWKKIYELNEMYEMALKLERTRYDVLLEEEKKKRGLYTPIENIKG